MNFDNPSSECNRRSIISPSVALLLIVCIGHFSSILIPALTGNSPNALSLLGAILWPSLLFMIVWVRLEKRRIVGLIAGAALGYVIYTLIVVIAVHNQPKIIEVPELTLRQKVIMQNVMSVSGSLEKSQYDEFWADFRTINPESREQFIKHFRAELPILLEYQRTLWLAAKESIKKKQPVITPELKKEFVRAELHDKNHPGERSRELRMKHQAQELLEAAASKSSVTRDGLTFQITPEVVDETLNGLDNSLARLLHLLSTRWQPPVSNEK